MTYHKVNLHLHQKHAEKLQHLKRVAISQKHLNGTHYHPEGHAELHLSKCQIQRIKEAVSKGKSAQLTLSKKQIQHHIQHGNGWFSDGLRKIYSTVKNIVNHVTPHAKKIAHEIVLPIVKPVFEDVKKRAISSAAEVGRQALDKAHKSSTKAVDDLTRIAKKELSGGSFCDDLQDGIGSVVKTVSPLVIPVIQAAAVKRLGGSGLHSKRLRGKNGKFVKNSTCKTSSQVAGSLYM